MPNPLEFTPAEKEKIKMKGDPKWAEQILFAPQSVEFYTWLLTQFNKAKDGSYKLPCTRKEGDENTFNQTGKMLTYFLALKVINPSLETQEKTRLDAMRHGKSLFNYNPRESAFFFKPESKKMSGRFEVFQGLARKQAK